MTYFATAAMVDPSRVEIQWPDGNPSAPVDTVAGFVEALRAAAARTPEGAVHALVKGMDTQAAYVGDAVTVLTVNTVGGLTGIASSVAHWDATTNPQMALVGAPEVLPAADTKTPPPAGQPERRPAAAAPLFRKPGAGRATGAKPEEQSLSASLFGDGDSLFGAPVADTAPKSRVVTSLPEITIAVGNRKGGPGKTTIARLLAEAAAQYAGHNDIAVVDINPAGNLHEHTTKTPDTGDVLGLARMVSREPVTGTAEFGRSPRDLDKFTSWQASGWVTVTGPPSIVGEDGELVSDLTATDVRRIVTTLRQTCRMIVFDTGNNPKDQAWDTVMRDAHRILIPTGWDPDTMVEAQKMLLDADALGYPALKERVIWVGTYPPGRKPNRRQEKQYKTVLQQSGWKVMEIPPDRHIATATIIDWSKLARRTRNAATALVEELTR